MYVLVRAVRTTTGCTVYNSSCACDRESDTETVRLRLWTLTHIHHTLYVGESHFKILVLTPRQHIIHHVMMILGFFDSLSSHLILFFLHSVAVEMPPYPSLNLHPSLSLHIISYTCNRLTHTPGRCSPTNRSTNQPSLGRR